jgi:2-methylisocitrate lyase-like PEP mutase family enzyme
MAFPLGRHDHHRTDSAVGAGTGAGGIGIEGCRASCTLAPTQLHAAEIAAAKEAVPSLFVNARTDSYWLGGHGAETRYRPAACQRADCDRAFVPGVIDPAGIAVLVGVLEAP